MEQRILVTRMLYRTGRKSLYYSKYSFGVYVKDWYEDDSQFVDDCDKLVLAGETHDLTYREKYSTTLGRLRMKLGQQWGK